jgi:hypothetical protein
MSGQDTTLIIEDTSASNRGMYRAQLRPNVDGYTINEMAPFVGPIPGWGESFSCEVPPARTFSAPTISGTETHYLRVCIYDASDWCSVHGDVESTPEGEDCSVGYAFTLGVLQSGVAFGRRGGSWLIESASAGMVSANSRTVSDLPMNSDVTIVIADGTLIRWQLVVQYTGSGYILQSMTRL